MAALLQPALRPARCRRPSRLRCSASASRRGLLLAITLPAAPAVAAPAQPLALAQAEAPLVAYSAFKAAVKHGDVAQVLFVDEHALAFQLKQPTTEYEPLVQPPRPYERLLPAKPPPPATLPQRTVFRCSLPAQGFDSGLGDQLAAGGVTVAAVEADDARTLDAIEFGIRLSLLAGFSLLFLGNSDGGLSSLLKRPAKLFEPGDGGATTFADVAGCDESKRELEETVDFLKNPTRYTALGARAPRGVLLVGPPGTGKTLLAKAVAGEAGVPFFSASASEFVELFVGLGGRRVRSLFAEARKRAPCVVFIDELDAVGKTRAGSGSGSNVGGVANEEREQTLNQLLTELDGFGSTRADEPPVIVLAATNRPETLDPALKRPGRFDRTVTVGLPDRAGRAAILQVHLRALKADALAPAVNLDDVAALTSGLSGAQLAAVVNEAALLAARRRAAAVETVDLTAATERVLAGLERRSLLVSPAERTAVAAHEAGHAIIAALATRASGDDVAAGSTMPSGVRKVSIIPRTSGALGVTLAAPEGGDRLLASAAVLRGTLATLMGGRAGELAATAQLTNGAADDLRRATALAHDMVARYGMSSAVGPRALAWGSGGYGGADTPSPVLASSVDAAVDALLRQADGWAGAAAAANLGLLQEMAAELLRADELGGPLLQALLARSVAPPGFDAWVARGEEPSV